jgi:YggT family protein
MGATAAILAVLFFDAVSAAENFVSVFIGVYVLLIIAYILTSWIRLPYSPTLNRVQRFLYDVCEPYLRLFRRLIPAIGPIDFSPVVGIIVLIVLNRLILTLIDRLH